MPAAPAAGAAYLTHHASVVTVRMARAAISARHRQGADDEPCKHPGVVQVLKGLSRSGRGPRPLPGAEPRLARRRSRRAQRPRALPVACRGTRSGSAPLSRS